jgi:hypothetical protein
MISKNGYMKKYLFLLIVVGALVGCSPQVTSELVTEGLSPQPTNKVMIVGEGESTEDMQTIGQVTVDGKSESVKSQYGKMLGLAVRETAQKGGNMLVVDNSAIDKNLLKGTMGHTDSKVIDSLTLSVKRINELEGMLPGRKPKVEADAAINNKVEEPETTPKEEMEPQGIMFKIGAGPMWTTSRLYYTSKDYLTNQRGYGMSLSIASTGDKFWGFGADFYGSRTVVDVPKFSRSGESSYLMMYLGPSVLVVGKIADWMRVDLSLGIGGSYYQDDGQSTFGFGVRNTIGLEFKVTKTVGIGADLVRQRCIISKPDDIDLPDNELYGYEHLGAMLTIRLHY